MDESTAKSILEAYGKAVAETRFDHVGKASPMTECTVGDGLPHPDAEKGEIDHFNRVGGQWRLVVKNAVLKRRSVKTVDNGKPGRSFRKRNVLDWDDEGDDDRARGKGSSASTLDDPRDETSDVHHFKGTVQILAYDDDT